MDATTSHNDSPSAAQTLGALEASVYESTRLLHESVASHAWQAATEHARVRLRSLQQAGQCTEEALLPRVRALFNFVLDDNGMLGPDLESARKQLKQRLVQQQSRRNASRGYAEVLPR
ncbi:MAG TPA: hypothetical protein VF265_10095 [Nevskiaceae bacterium]